MQCTAPLTRVDGLKNCMLGLKSMNDDVKHIGDSMRGKIKKK